MAVACPEYSLLIEALADDELTVVQMEAVREHMTVCPDCAAYHAELTSLHRRLRCLALERCDSDIAEGVVRAAQRRAKVRLATVIVGLSALKLLDVLGYFGSGLPPRLIVAAGAMFVFVLLGFNPLSLVHVTSPSDSSLSLEGEHHADS